MLAGPAVIGWLTRYIPLNTAFFLPVACCAVAALTAGSLLPARPADDTPPDRLAAPEGAGH